MNVKKNRLIFVVEDNKLYNKVIVEFLNKNGFKKVVAFYNGNDFVNTVKNGQHPDIVILDYFLEDSKGDAIFEDVKSRSRHTKFIFLTANKNMDAAVDLIKLGAVDYIIKEKDPALKRMYREVLRASKMIEIERRNMFVKNAMIITLIVLVAIVVFVVLNNVLHLV